MTIEKIVKKQDDSNKSDKVSDEKWHEITKGYDELQLALRELANEIGADYEADTCQEFTKYEGELADSGDMAKSLLTTAGNQSIMGRPRVEPELLSAIDPNEFVSAVLAAVDNSETRQLLLYPADGLGITNCILEKIQSALDRGYSEDRIASLLDSMAFNLNVPVATSRNPDVEAFILPNGGILFQSEDRFYKVKPDPLKEILISKVEQINELTELASANAATDKNKNLFCRVVFLSHDYDGKNFSKLNTPPSTLNDSDQCVAIIIAGIDLSPLKKLNPGGVLLDLIENQQIVLLRSFADRVFLYGVEYATNCYYNDNQATEDTLAAVYSIAALREYNKAVGYDYLADVCRTYDDSTNQLAKHFVDRTRWLCEQAGFGWADGRSDNTHAIDIPKLVQAKISNLDYMQDNVSPECWGYSENWGCVSSYAKLQYNNSLWHPSFFGTQKNLPISYPVLNNCAKILIDHPYIFLLDLSLRMFEDLDDLRQKYKDKIFSIICEPLGIAESDVMVFDEETNLVGIINNPATHQFINELVANIGVAMAENNVASFAEALDYVDYPVIKIGFCKEGMPLKKVCNIAMEFSEDYNYAILNVPHLGIYQSFDFGDLDSGNISYGLV